MTSVASENTYVDHWYEVVDDTSLRQGDIFRNLLAFWPEEGIAPTDAELVPDGYAKLEFQRADFIIASASCDVGQRNYPYALLSRIVTASEANLNASGKDFDSRIEVIRQGLVPSQFLLAPCGFVEPALELSLVQHKVHTLLPVPYLQKCCTGKRLRMKHPHRERFGNWVGGNFARVGPEDSTLIPQKAKMFPAHILKANADDVAE
jgi:hypothetical protein